MILGITLRVKGRGHHTGTSKPYQKADLLSGQWYFSANCHLEIIFLGMNHLNQ